MTPVEIMARAVWVEFEDRDPFDRLPQTVQATIRREMLRAIAALEAAGWRIVHPENVTEEMKTEAREALRCNFDDRIPITLADIDGAIFDAIAAAPLHGKG